MTFAAAFANIATGFSTAFGAPFASAVVHSSGAPILDDGGSIVTPGDASARSCVAQIDTATDAMRTTDGFVEGDVRILVLADGITGTITTDDRIEIEDAGMWSIQSVSRDPAGIGFELRGRKAT